MKNWKTSAESILTTGPVVPVIVVKKLEHAVPMAKALVAGGVRVLEVTLRTECAVDAIRTIAKEVPEAIVGAGTVLNPQQLAEVTEAGAQFAISPGLLLGNLRPLPQGTAHCQSRRQAVHQGKYRTPIPAAPTRECGKRASNHVLFLGLGYNAPVPGYHIEKGDRAFDQPMDAYPDYRKGQAPAAE